jgi:hypothetical protein
MTDDTETIRLLRSIDRRLALQTADAKRRLRARLRADLLTTAARTAMFDVIDGRTGSPELAKTAGVSNRAAQLFVKELLDLGLVVVAREATGRGVIVEKDEDAILRWYLDSGDAAVQPGR